MRKQQTFGKTSPHHLPRVQLPLALLTILFSLLSACSGGSSGSGSAGQPQTPEPVIGNPAFIAADVQVSWNLPAVRTDGSPLEMGDIGGVELLTINNETAQELTYTVTNGVLTSFTINQLEPADYDIFVFVYDSNNIVSAPAQLAIAIEDFPPA